MMNHPRAQDTQDASHQRSIFYRTIAITQRHAMKLASALNQQQFMNAWLESMDLGRSIDLAAVSLARLSAFDRGEADERLACLWSVVHRLQAMAPRPSDTAIAQAHARRIPASRNAWQSERRAWITERRTQGPIVLASGPDGLMLSCREDT